MNLSRIHKNNKTALCSYNLFTLTFFTILSTVFCESCGTKSNKGGYIPNIKGNIASIKTDKTELIGPKRDFNLKFIVEDTKDKVNISNYSLHLYVIGGQVSYSCFCLEDGGKKRQGKTSAFSLGISNFFENEKVEFTADEINSGKISIPFTIIPNPGVSWASVSMELVEETEKGENIKGKVTVDWSASVAF